MKHVKNKSNISIVKDYLEGNRPFTQIGYVPEAKSRSVGERWTDFRGVEWEQRNGYKTRINHQADIIRKVLEQKCKCGQAMKWGSRLDNLFYSKTGMCEKCLIDYETKLRILGIYPVYEKYKLLSNEIGFLKDAKQKLKEIIKFFTDNSGDVELLCNSEGFTERFKNTNKEKILRDSRADLTKIRRRLTEISKEKESAKSEYLAKSAQYQLESYA